MEDGRLADDKFDQRVYIRRLIRESGINDEKRISAMTVEILNSVELGTQLEKAVFDEILKSSS